MRIRTSTQWGRAFLAGVLIAAFCGVFACSQRPEPPPAAYQLTLPSPDEATSADLAKIFGDFYHLVFGNLDEAKNDSFVFNFELTPLPRTAIVN